MAHEVENLAKVELLVVQQEIEEQLAERGETPGALFTRVWEPGQP